MLTWSAQLRTLEFQDLIMFLQVSPRQKALFLCRRPCMFCYIQSACLAVWEESCRRQVLCRCCIYS